MRVKSKPLGMPRRHRVLGWCGWYEPRMAGSWSTTHQAAALNTAITRTVDRVTGVVAGLNAATNEIEVIDQFTQYNAVTDDGITGINVVLLGDIGTGKSSAAKTLFVIRQLITGRQVVIFDKKLQSGRGEYCQLAEDIGAPSIRFVLGSSEGAHINPLDPMISAGGEHDDAEPGQVPKGQEALIGAIIEDAMDRALRTEERGAVGCALDAVNREAAGEGRQPVIRDLALRLLNPLPGDLDSLGPQWVGRVENRWGRDPGITLLRLADRDLRGLIDQPTSPVIRDALQSHPVVHFDLSALPTHGPALRVVMTVINTWLSNRMVQRSRLFQQTIVVVEEAALVAVGSTGRVFYSDAKLSRGIGKSTVLTYQHPPDPVSDPVSYALVKEASIVMVYRQHNYDDAKRICETYNFPPGSEQTIMTLPQGSCLVKAGDRHPYQLEHVRSPQEVAWTDTNDATKGRAT